METPEHERRAVEDYLYSQSGEDFEVEHVEKLTSEYVLGQQYDVWDAHTNESRWWVITNPTNLYSQELIKSMDVALSFHVGLMSHMIALRPARRSRDEWILDVLRRMDVAYASLDRAHEVEDFQAVGMRLRETLLTLGERLAGLVAEVAPMAEEPKRGDFKAWADVAAELLAAGSESKYLRGLLKATSEKTWAYVSWLTHARRATELDARLACGMTSQVTEAFITAVTRWRLGAAGTLSRVRVYQLTLDYIDDEWAKLCSVCGRMEPAEAPHPVQEPLDEPEASVPRGGECVEVEDFGIYLSPQQAKFERLVCQSPVDEHGRLRVVVAERRGDYGNPSVASGWLHPPDGADEEERGAAPHTGETPAATKPFTSSADGNRAGHNPAN